MSEKIANVQHELISEETLKKNQDFGQKEEIVIILATLMLFCDSVDFQGSC